GPFSIHADAETSKQTGNMEVNHPTVCEMSTSWLPARLVSLPCPSRVKLTLLVSPSPPFQRIRAMTKAVKRMSFICAKNFLETTEESLLVVSASRVEKTFWREPNVKSDPRGIWLWADS